MYDTAILVCVNASNTLGNTCLTSCINSCRGNGYGTQQQVLLSSYATDLHFLANNQTIAEIMLKVTRPGSNPQCVMWCPDKSHIVRKRMNHSNSAFRTVSRKDQENQWSGFLLPLWRHSEGLHFYTSTAGPSPLAMGPSMLAQPCSPLHPLTFSVQHSPEPGRH